MKKMLVLLGVALVGTGVLLMLPSGLLAQSQGEFVDFVVPEETSVFTGEAGDMVVFTGKSQGTVHPGSCGDPTIDNHVYQTVFVDPGAGRAARLTTVVVTSHPDGVAPGTRLVNLQLLNQCALGGANYTKYRSIVR